MQARGDAHRNVCIIPVSAHGTNPASAAMCGMKIVTVGTDAHGNVDIAQLRAAAEKHKDNLSALMVSVRGGAFGCWGPWVRGEGAGAVCAEVQAVQCVC